MKITGNNFKYFIDEKEYSNFDAFEKAVNKIEIKEIKVEGLNIYAKSI